MKIRRQSILLGVILLAAVALLAIRLHIRGTNSAIPIFTNQSSLGILGPARIRFPNRLVEPPRVEIAISPSLQTSYHWAGEELVIWFDTPAEEGRHYNLSLLVLPALEGETEQRFSWDFRPRPVEVLYLVQDGAGADLWSAQADGSEPRQLTQTRSSIIDYAVSSDGSILAAVLNREGGADLWRFDRSGAGMQQAVACGPQRCTEAQFLSRSESILFAETPGPQSVGSGNFLKLLHPGSQEVILVFTYEGRRMEGLTVSPDGSWVSFVDSELGTLTLVNLEDGRTKTLDCGSSEAGAFSPDSERMIFACMEPGTGNPCKLLQEIRLDTLEVSLSPAFPILERRDYGTPQWSLDGHWMVFGERCFNDRVTRQLWLVDTNTYTGKAITSEVRFTYAGYQWHPNSEQIVFQRFEVGSSAARPEILTWSLRTEAFELLIQGAHTPAWLP